MTSTAKKTLLSLFILLTITTASADFYDNSGNAFNDGYLTTPQFDSQEEIATELVAPFIFVAVLLHFALSRALNFILAEDIENENYHKVPYTIPLVDRGYSRDHPDASKYAMIMSLTITGSLVPTPYWGIIQGVMGVIAASSVLAMAAGVLFIIYLMSKGLSQFL